MRLPSVLVHDLSTRWDHGQALVDVANEAMTAGGWL